jgi:hypothetical protein
MSKTIKCSVVHASLYLMVGGELAHQEKGTVLNLDEETAKRLGAKVSPVMEQDAVDVGDAKAEAAKAEAAKAEAAKAEAAKAEAAKAEAAKTATTKP